MEGVQFPNRMIHSKVYAPVINPVTLVDGAVESAITGVFGPLMNRQTPVPNAGVLADKVVEVTTQRSWSGPAYAVLGPVTIVIATLEEVTQVPFVMVHRNI